MESMFGVKLEKKEKPVKVNKAEVIVVNGNVFDLKIGHPGNVIATARTSRPDLYKAAVDRLERPAYEDYHTHIRRLDGFGSALWDSMAELRRAIESNNYIIQ